MIKELEIHEDELLGDWISRVAKYISTHEVSEEALRAILHDVSFVSYCRGSVTCTRILKK